MNKKAFVAFLLSVPALAAPTHSVVQVVSDSAGMHFEILAACSQMKGIEMAEYSQEDYVPVDSRSGAILSQEPPMLVTGSKSICEGLCHAGFQPIAMFVTAKRVLLSCVKVEPRAN